MKSNITPLQGIANLPFLSEEQFFFIGGPCVVENEETTIRVAQHLKTVCEKLKIPFIFKASYRKANRSRGDSFSGLGDETSLAILQKVKEQLKVPIITDIHAADEAARVAEVVDILQIPAFLCRQTDLLLAAAHTGCVVNIKKGQFLSPDAMRFAAEKITHTGNNKVLLTERGTTFGYHDLVVDFRAIPRMRSLGYPVILDITHSLQAPNMTSGVTGGHPELIEHMGRLGIAAGCDGLFMETHPNPSKALSDGKNMLPLEKAEGMLQRLVTLREVMNSLPTL